MHVVHGLPDWLRPSLRSGKELADTPGTYTQGGGGLGARREALQTVHTKNSYKLRVQASPPLSLL